MFCLQYLDTSAILFFIFFYFGVACRWQLHIGTREETFFYTNVRILLLFVLYVHRAKKKTKEGKQQISEMLFVCYV